MTPNDLVILFDVDSDIEDVKRNMIRKPKIISFSYEAHEILKNNNIEHVISDAYLTRDELVQIQNKCYEIARWFENKEIANKISYQEINLGSLIKIELNYLLVPFVKKFVEIEKIVKRFNGADFLVSSVFYQITSSMTNSVIQLPDNKKNNVKFYYDSVKITLNIWKKNLNLQISRKRYEYLKKIFERFLEILFRPRDNNNKTILLIEFNPITYRKLFEAISTSGLNFNIFNRRRPPIWNFRSLFIIKNSGCRIISSRKILNKELQTHIENQKLVFEGNIKSVWQYNEYFDSVFSINGSTFWNFLKPTLIRLFTKRALDAIFEITLTKKMFENQCFSAILVWSETGFTEQILVKIAKKFKVPIILLQHGYFYDSEVNGAYNMNKFQGAYPIDADKYIVWGNIEKKHQIRCKTPSEKIHVLGSPQHDRILEFKERSEKFVLLATSGPVKENALDLTVETIQKNRDAIRIVCQTISKMNKKLIIKIHPSPDEFDPSDLAHQIDPKIKIVKTGDIASLISNCELVIVIDASTVILDAQLFKKPIISIIVKDSDYGIPSILQDGCLYTNIENLGDVLRVALGDIQFRETLVDRGTKYVNSYLINQNNATAAVIDLLKRI